MPVVIKYVVERDGNEKMTFTSKSEADAYDKLLDTADMLHELLDASTLLEHRELKEALAMYLAEHKDALLIALGTKKKHTVKPPKKPPEHIEVADNKAKNRKNLEDLIIEPDDDAFFEEEEKIVSFDEEADSYPDGLQESDAA